MVWVIASTKMSGEIPDKLSFLDNFSLKPFSPISLIYCSYNCKCWDGAEETMQDGNPICIDIDECALGYCKGGTCINNPGSFECK